MRDAIDVYRHAYAERMADWKTNAEQLAAAAAVIEADREQAAAEERAKIVAWLRSQGGHHDDIYEEAADDIEAGEHETFTRSSDT